MTRRLSTSLKNLATCIAMAAQVVAVLGVGAAYLVAFVQ